VKDEHAFAINPRHCKADKHIQDTMKERGAEKRRGPLSGAHASAGRGLEGIRTWPEKYGSTRKSGQSEVFVRFPAMSELYWPYHRHGTKPTLGCPTPEFYFYPSTTYFSIKRHVLTLIKLAIHIFFVSRMYLCTMLDVHTDGQRGRLTWSSFVVMAA